MNTKIVTSLGAMVLLAGCTATGSGSDQGAQQAASTQTAVSDQQARAKVHTELGSLYLLDGRSAIALEEARIAIAADANYAPAYNLLGLTHMGLNEMKQAEENFQKALRLAPGDPEISNNYGWFLCQTGREQQAIGYFMAAANNPLYTTPTKPYTNAGLCYLRIKDDKAAEENFRRAATVDGSNAQAIYHLSNLVYKQGDFASARKYLGEVHRLMDPNAESLWLGVRIERKLGDRQAEAGYASQLRRRFSGTPQHQALMQGNYE